MNLSHTENRLQQIRSALAYLRYCNCRDCARAWRELREELQQLEPHATAPSGPAAPPDGGGGTAAADKNSNPGKDSTL